MHPYLSVIIPYYNAPDKLERLLVSLGKSRKAPAFEVIIVDDGSTRPLRIGAGPVGGFLPRKPTRGPLRGSPTTPATRLSIRIVSLLHNKGPAIARNRGVKAARGTFVVFLDGDVEVFPDTLSEIAKVYKDDPDVVALTGVWVKEQKSTSFFPNFKALRDWSYWIHERDQSGYYFLFSTRIASIKKAVFTRLGGFDETYPAPLVEDIELTYRIARRYAIIFAPQVRVRHEFEEFWPIAKKYFLRAYYWTKLYANRKKFDPVATTLQEAVTAISGVGVVVTAVVAIIGGIVTFGDFTLPYKLLLMAFVLTFMIHTLFIRRFLVFVYREKGFAFAVKSFGMGLILYCFITAGALSGKFRWAEG